MKKKIIALVLACTMCISILVIPASASTKNLPSNWSHFISDLSDDFNAYRNGNITLTDFFDLYAKNCLKWGYNNVSDVTNFKDVLKGLENLGYDVPNAWQKYFYEYNEIEKDDSILQGYDVVLKKYSKVSSYSDKLYLSDVYYGSKGIFRNYKKDNDGNQQVSYLIYYDRHLIYNTSGELIKDDVSSSTFVSTYYYGKTNVVFLGNWIYEDASGLADDLIEPLPDKTIPNYDDDSIPENELIDFFDKLLEDLKLQFPDLSNLEGLLNAILAKLGTLDSDDDGSLLAEINTAIITLASDNHSDNQAIIALLTELKESLKGDKEKSDLSELLKKLDKMQTSLDYLCTINTIDTGIDLWKELTESEKTFLNEYAGIITTLINKCGLVTINNMIMNLNSVILCTSPPSDLTADIWGTQVTILSSDMFDSEAMRYIDIAKTFVSVLLVYSFCLILRRKIAGGGN